jgi:hypothetical protein
VEPPASRSDGKRFDVIADRIVVPVGDVAVGVVVPAFEPVSVVDGFCETELITCEFVSWDVPVPLVDVELLVASGCDRNQPRVLAVWVLEDPAVLVVDPEMKGTRGVVQ